MLFSGEHVAMYHFSGTCSLGDGFIFLCRGVEAKRNGRGSKPKILCFDVFGDDSKFGCEMAMRSKPFSSQLWRCSNV